jgi:hypothetical protein
MTLVLSIPRNYTSLYIATFYIRWSCMVGAGCSVSTPTSPLPLFCYNPSVTPPPPSLPLPHPTDSHHLSFLLRDATSLLIQWPDEEACDAAAARRHFFQYFDR